MRLNYDRIEDMITGCFPEFEKTYHISCPNLDREIVEKGTASYLNNLVIRPSKTPDMMDRLPDGQELIIIGDVIQMDRLNYIIVKGIELIDSGIASFGELQVEARASLRLESEKWSYKADYNDSLFSEINLKEIILRAYSIDDVSAVHKIKEKWEQYVAFQEHYIETQSAKSYGMSRCVGIDAYAIDRKTYRKRQDELSAYVVDQYEAFAKSHQILITKQIEDSNPMALVRVDFDIKKTVFDDRERKDKHKKSKELTERIAFTSNNMSLSKTKPAKSIDENKDMLREAITLGDRYKIHENKSIEPDYSDIENRQKQKLKKEYERINQINEHHITTTVDQEIDKLRNNLEKENKLKLDEYSKRLFDKIEEDVRTQANREAEKAYQERVQSIRHRMDQQMNTKIKELRSKGEKKKNKKNSQEIDEKIHVIRSKHDQATKNEIDRIDRKQIYVDTYLALVDTKEKDMARDLVNILKREKASARKRLQEKHAPLVQKEKDQALDTITKETKELKDQRYLEKKIIRLSFYFKYDGEYEELSKELEKIKPRFLIYNNRAEKAKVDREAYALKHLFNGYVRNPFLMTYLFSPEKLGRNDYEKEELTWFLEHLNDKQKEAVQRAITSNGIFLLQGPPGTGKTQVIAEIIGHLIKMGKKVLMSSETHKAIDNVFERIPKIPEIRPIRLIPTRKGGKNKKTNYGPENLVDNFYNNIATQMQHVIDVHENHETYKREFEEKLNEIVILNRRLKELMKNMVTVKKTIENKKTAIEKYQKTVSESKHAITRLSDEKEDIDRVKWEIENHTFDTEPIADENSSYSAYVEYVKTIKNIYRQHGESLNQDQILVALEILSRLSSDHIREQIKNAKANPKKLALETRKEKIKKELSSKFDDYNEVIPGYQDEIRRLRDQLKTVNSEMKKMKEGKSDDSEVFKILSKETMMSHDEESLVHAIKTIQKGMEDEKNRILDDLEKNKIRLDEQNEKRQKELSVEEEKIRRLNLDIKHMKEESAFSSYEQDDISIKRKIEKFYKDMRMPLDYDDYDNAIERLRRKWREIETEKASPSRVYKQRVNVYKKIIRYLEDDDVIESDKINYTKHLFDKANLFGLTTTSRDHFQEKHNEELEKFSLGSINLKEIGIDVVIIDEVSKSSFIELLIPILYGKTVILVGDHRQLPPMYAYKHMREDDFAVLDSKIIDDKKNKEFGEMYEESFFKILFEKMPEDYKVRLNQQYRSHQHIMDVYNHFYDNQLKLGLENQNRQKEHHLTIRANNGRELIEPSKHVYFIDCHAKENRDDHSTSIFNLEEANVVFEMLKRIDQAYLNNKDMEATVNRKRELDERMSVGVITTYGDQAKRIKQIIFPRGKRAYRFNSFNERSDSKLIISTVDDFQGDERDIIILSMVRNPNTSQSNPGFINAYQRINVALSRARRLIIIVGNKDYLQKKGVIKLPNIDGIKDRDQERFRIYENIIRTIETHDRGRVFSSTEILQGGDSR